MIFLKGIVLKGIGLKRSDPQTQCSSNEVLLEHRDQ